MTLRAIPLVALVTALCWACNGRSAQTEASGTTSPATHEHSAGDERGLPKVEAYAHRLDDPSRDAWQKPEEVVRLLDPPTGGTVVDLGAGTGYFVPFLSRAVGSSGRVLGLDISPSAVAWLEKVAEEEGLDNVEVRTVAPNDPGLPDKSADRILIANTWHHIEDRVTYARKLRPALRRRGQVMIVDFTMESPIGPPADHRLTIDTVVGELRAAGFETQVLEESLPHQYIVTGSAR